MTVSKEITAGHYDKRILHEWSLGLDTYAIAKNLGGGYRQSVVANRLAKLRDSAGVDADRVKRLATQGTAA